MIEAGYNLFLPLDNRSELVMECPNGQLLRCFLQNASIDKNRSPIARIPEEAFDRGLFLAIYDKPTNSVWLIPPDQLESRQILRLGRKYEEFILPEPIGLSYKEQRDMRSARSSGLKEAAQEAADKMFRKS